MADARLRIEALNSHLAKVLLDLHRCEHGRLEADPCLGCGGMSAGNTIIPPGTVIGHNRYGDEIVVPPWEDHNEPKKWVQAR